MKSIILIVDDVPCNLEYVEEIIADDAIEVLKTTEAKEAIRIAREHKPDLILLDIAMPEMNGYEVCKILKADKDLNDIPIIFLTARVQEEDIIKGFESGAVDYIVKPFNFRELLSRVHTHLDLKKKSEELINMNLTLEDLVNERTSQLKRTNEELKQAYFELTRLDTAKSEFMQHINHELRTPLNGILGYLSLLEENTEEKLQNDYIKPIKNISKRLIKVAELSLLITELKTNNNSIKIEPINIVQSLNKAIEYIEFEEKNLTLAFAQENEEIYAIAESSLLSTCIRIILDNAVKYSSNYGTVQILIDKNGQQTTIDVLDSGPGFTEKALASVFTIFKADNLDYRSHGFGLGLATAKKILEILNGNLQIENRSEGGARVCIMLKSN